MRRRTFLASLPCAAASGPLLAAAAQPSAAPVASPEAGPPLWGPGEERFVRGDVQAGDRPVGASFASRTAAYGLSGAAGTAHPLATMAGIEMLKRGGSAVDAAVAINACLGFLEPTSSGIGGDCFAMLWDPAERKVVGIAGSGASPRALSLDIARAHARGGALPPLGAVTISVPGAVDAWWTLHRRYGRLRWADLFEPAIGLAENGAPVPDVIAHYIRANLAAFRRPGAGIEEIDNAMRTWAPDGASPSPGGFFRNPDLARTYRMIAEGGRDAYYEGEIARTIDAYFRRVGGWLRREDLAAHHSEWVEPYAPTIAASPSTRSAPTRRASRPCRCST